MYWAADHVTIVTSKFREFMSSAFYNFSKGTYYVYSSAVLVLKKWLRKNVEKWKLKTYGPQLGHLSKTAIAYLQMPCNILPVLPQQLGHKFDPVLKRSNVILGCRTITQILLWPHEVSLNKPHLRVCAMGLEKSRLPSDEASKIRAQLFKALLA